MKARLVSLRQRIGHRGAVLLFFAFLDFVYAASLFHPPADVSSSPMLRFAATVLPLTHWAVLWLIAGVVLGVGAFWRHDGAAFAMAVAIKTLWGGLFLLGWLLSGLPRGWLTAVVWLAMAVMLGIISTWPEPARRGR